MNNDKSVDRIFGQDFPDLVANLIWQNSEGNYEIFHRFVLVPEKPLYYLYQRETLVGVFHSTRNAMAWCVAVKFGVSQLAREILILDNKIAQLAVDIAVRGQSAERSQNIEFRENVAAKLETKIIKKKQLEIDLKNCIKRAKYMQQRGFYPNETSRTSRNKAVKNKRKSV